MTLQQSLAGDLFWGVVNAIVLVWVAVGVLALIRRVRMVRMVRDRRRAPKAHCQIGACSGAPYAIYGRHPAGAIIVCQWHAQDIQAQARRRRDEAVYDQDLDPGTDLALWDREMQS